MSRCVIFGAGEYDAQTPVREEGDFFIAADGGYAEMLSRGFTPDLLIGDLDSLGAPPAGVPLVTLPVEKDVTDTDAAVSEGLRRGYRSFALYGVFGGRPDHTLANYALLARLSQQGCEARGCGGGFTVTALTNGALELPARQSGAAAVFSWTDESAGVTVRGLKYGLENGVLRSNFALGVSNSFIGEPAYIEVKQGTLLIFAQTR